MKKEDFDSIFDSLNANYTAENVALYQSIIDSVEIESFATPNDFSMISSKWERFLDGFLTVKVGENEKLKFLFMQNNFVEGYFRKIFEMFDGSACCADKARTIIRALSHYYQNGEEISFNYQQEYTYHLPENILNTHDEIVKVYEAIYSLYYRNPFELFAVLTNMQKQLSKE